MLAGGWGRIVNIASTAGLVGYGYVSAYCAAKHGLVGLTRALALEVATKGITVNAVCPGYTETDMVRERSPNSLPRPGGTPEQALAGAGGAQSAEAVWSSLRKWPMPSRGCACREAKRSRDKRSLCLAAR